MGKRQQLLSVTEAATILDRTPSMVRHYIRKGQLRIVREIGQRYLLDRRVVRAFKPNPAGNPNFGKKKTPAAKRNGKKTYGTIRKKRRK